MSLPALRVASLGLMALLSATGCAEPLEEGPLPGPDDATIVAVHYVEICVRKTTLVRAEDQRCDDEKNGHAWYFVPMTAKVPAVGGKGRSGTFVEPGDASPYFYRASRAGGEGEHGMALRDSSPIQICVNKRAQTRIPDVHCDEKDHGNAWYYLSRSRQIPAVGQKAANGSFRALLYGTIYRAPPGGGKGSEVAFASPR